MPWHTLNRPTQSLSTWRGCPSRPRPTHTRRGSARTASSPPDRPQLPLLSSAPAPDSLCSHGRYLHPQLPLLPVAPSSRSSGPIAARSTRVRAGPLVRLLIAVAGNNTRAGPPPDG